MGFVSKIIKSLFGTKPEESTHLVTGMDREIATYHDQVDLIVQAFGLTYNMPEVKDVMENAQRYIVESWEHPSGQNEAIMRLLGANPYRCVLYVNEWMYSLEKGPCTLGAVSILEHFISQCKNKGWIITGIDRIETFVTGVKLYEGSTERLMYTFSSADDDEAEVSARIIEHFTGVAYSQILGVYAKSADNNWRQIYGATLAH